MISIHEYTLEDMRAAQRNEDLSMSTSTSLIALSTETIVSGEAIGGSKAVEIFAWEVEDSPTGYIDNGAVRLVFINTRDAEEDNITYDVVSQLHTKGDADIYLWSAYPYAATYLPMGVHMEWYRRDVYPDDIEPFDGTLGWADLPREIEL